VRMKEFEERLSKLTAGRVKRVGSWDSGINYSEIKELLLEALNHSKCAESDTEWKRLMYFTILLIQLRNGSRISETVEAFLEWVKTGEREVWVRVRKKRKGSEELRSIIIPGEIHESWRKIFMVDLKNVSPETLTLRVKRWASKHKINTHALRYARITQLLEEGLSPPIVSDIVGHADIKMLMKYTQKERARELNKMID